jgi:hypothetical protein
MPCLKNLNVKKVSFVRRGANKREFFLAKSADFRGSNQEGDVNNNNKSGGATTMRPEVRLKLGEILKKERDVERVCALLKEDTVLKAQDSEIAEVRDFVALIPAPDPTPALELAKSQDTIAKAEAARVAAETELKNIKETTHKAEIKKWVSENCSHLTGMNADEATEKILKAEKVDADTAETLKKSFQSTSDALKASEIVKEIGRGGEDSYDPIGGNLVAEVSKVASELKKSDSSRSGSNAVIAAIRSTGHARYENYRKEFNHRVRTQ